MALTTDRLTSYINGFKGHGGNYVLDENNIISLPKGIAKLDGVGYAIRQHKNTHFAVRKSDDLVIGCILVDRESGTSANVAPPKGREGWCISADGESFYKDEVEDLDALIGGLDDLELA